MPSIRLPIVLLVAVTLFLAACQSGKQTIQPGTPAFFWSSAKQAYSTGDYPRAAEQFGKLTQSDNEYRDRAQTALVLLSSGMVKGYLEVADAYVAGGRMNPNNRTAFHKRASTARSHAKSALMQLIEATHVFTDRAKAETVEVDLGYPTGTLAELPALLKVMKGVLPPDSEAESSQIAAIQKGVLATVCSAGGAKDDSAKAAEVFKQPPVKLARGTVMFAVGEALVDHSRLFGPKELDEPLRLKMLLTEAQEALALSPPSKERKELEAKIQKGLKTIKPS